MQQNTGNSGSGSLETSSTDVSWKAGPSVWKIHPQSGPYHASSDASLFSSSLPVLGHNKLNLKDKEQEFKLFGDVPHSLNRLHPDFEGNELLEDGGSQLVGSLLPDDEDELLAGIDIGWLSNLVDSSEECDLFGSGGGLELESDLQENTRVGFSQLSLSNGSVGNGVAQYNISNGVGTVSGEHPLGEHPSRTLFVRNINSNVEDSELRELFEQYGDIRTLYTACKHRGFVMISYYDIRAARNAMRSLQNKPIRRRKMDIHFSIPKENPSDKDVNQGTLVVFNLDPTVTNDDLLHIFGAYGEVKEIRETPHKRHHKFIEYYDTRAADAALKSLNRSDIAGKRIKLEPSRPGGARRSLMLQPNHDLEQDEQNLRQQLGSSIGNSPPGNWPRFGSPMELNSLQHFSKLNDFGPSSSAISNCLPGLASVLQPPGPTLGRAALSGKDSLLQHILTNGNPNRLGDYALPHSLPEQKSNPYSFNGTSPKPLSPQQFLWGSPEFSNLSVPRTQRHHLRPSGDRFPLLNNGSFPSPSQFQQLHHVGSAPSGIPFERKFGIYEDSSKTSLTSPHFEGVGIGHGDRSFSLKMGYRGPVKASAVSRNVENGSLGFQMSAPKLSPVLLDNSKFPGVTNSNFEGLGERRRFGHFASKGMHMDGKKQFQLDLDKIRSGEDTRTTLMIKNIPNKYTSKMLLATIDEQHKGTYDFLYLPIDFKNKCNVGYAFINMLSPSHIIPFYEAFNGKRWEKFNSEKVASLAFARIQGRTALVAHFQNSSLMNEDKRCRPILFSPEGQELNDHMIQESVPSSSLNFQVCQSNGGDTINPNGTQLHNVSDSDGVKR